MRVTETKTKTTLYDSNGKQISVVRQTILEVDDAKPLRRKDCLKIKNRVESYQDNLSKAKVLKDDLQKTRGVREGGRIFRDLAELIVIIEK